MDPTKRQLMELPTAAIRPNPRQPRRFFDPEGLAELSASIRQQGILQPLTVIWAYLRASL